MSSLWIDSEKKNYVVHPHKFNLWLFIIATTMIFGGLTSAYVVARSFISPEKRVMFDLPPILWQNTLIIIFSSVTVQYAVWASKRNEPKKAVWALVLTLLLGLGFLFGQLIGWQDMVASGLPLVNHARSDSSVSFFYVFTGLHGAHIFGTLFFLILALSKTALNAFKMNRRTQTIELVAIFWHFLGALWIYLFAFLLLTQ